MELSILQILLWLVAGLLSFYFSVGNARVWTSIAVGFFLILFGEFLPHAMPFLPGAQVPQIEAMGYIIGTISILIMSHGFLEYYVFTRTLELEGNKLHVYLTTLAVIGASLVFILINPPPDADTLRTIRIVGNTNWVFLSLINIDLIRKIYLNIKGSPISNGFLAFVAVFVCIFLWKGSELYIQVYHLDLPAMIETFPVRYQISHVTNMIGNMLASLSVGGTFLYLAGLLR